MSSTTRKIPPSEWERHRDIIVELYRKKPLKEVRAEMQTQHNFNASPWQYEMQLKRWDIRKNATRNEWQQFFSINQGRSIPTSLDAPGRDFPTVILSKSTGSKKRASRWAPGSLVEPSVTQASGSATSGHEAHPVAAPIPTEILGPGTTTRADMYQPPLDRRNAISELESVPVHTDLAISSMSATINLRQATSSPEFFDVSDGSAQFLGVNPAPLHASFSPVAPELQPLFLEGNPFDGDMFLPLGISAENNVTFSMLKGTNFKQELPSAQLEQSLRFNGIVLDRAAGSAIFGGFVSKFIAGILSAKDQSIARRTPQLQHFLRKLDSQIPGESSALITDDQAFETKFVRALLFSMLNGFAGLDDVPMENILRFLNRFVANKLLFEILEQCPRHVSRTLADNIFRAAIEAADTKVVNLLLSRKLLDVNETVCLVNGEKYTPIERAAVLRSLKLMKALIDVGADVHKSYRSLNRETWGGALGALISDIEADLWARKRSVVTPESLETIRVLIAAGGRVCPEMVTHDDPDETMDLNFLICQHVSPDSHQGFFKPKSDRQPHIWPLISLARQLDDCRATKAVQNAISLCHQAHCNKCFVGLGDTLRDTIIGAASAGKIKLVQLLFENADFSPEYLRIFIAAIESQNPALVDYIFRHGIDLDPPAIEVERDSEDFFATPIAEAVRCGNEDLIQKCEAQGALDHLIEGNRFEAVIAAAAQAGNMAYMRKLLARAVTSKQAYRERGMALFLAFEGGYEDIVQVLLEAGATFGQKGSIIHPPWTSFAEASSPKSVQILHALIASGASASYIRQSLTQADQSIFTLMVHEYPGFDFAWHDLEHFLNNCIKTDTSENFQDIVKVLHVSEIRTSLESCLAIAAELGHCDLVEYLLDMGANPFDDSVLMAVIPDRPDMLQRLFRQDRRRQIMPRCIGVRVLKRIMGNDAGNAEALDELIRTRAINFARLEIIYPGAKPVGVPQEYYNSIRFTPLGLAIDGLPWSFDTNIVAMRKFLEAGADPNGISKSNERWTKGSPLMTALMVAIEKGREDAVTMLLDHGADPNACPRIRTTRTALQYAAELGNADMVRLLLSRGADVNSSASPNGGATALQFAALTGNCNMAEELLDHGARLDALPSRIDGMWPLEGAAANGRLDMIRFLWELNVRAVARGTFPGGFSERHCLRAMHFARENGQMGCRDLISELSGVSVDRLETDEYGAPWIAY